MPRRPTGSGRTVSTYRTADFTGGLNVVADQAHLAPNQTADCLNVRLLPQGGLQARSSLGALSGTTAKTNCRNLWPFYRSSGLPLIVTQDGNTIRYRDTTNTWTTITTGSAPFNVATSGIMRAATMARASAPGTAYNYIQRNIEQVPVKFTGTSASAMTDAHNSYNENLALPAGGKMPVAQFITEHAGYMVHGSTKEGSTSFPYRVRWSHPGEPEDYRKNDWVDVGVDDADPITGLCSAGSQLFIFKSRSVWVLSGYNPDTFQLRKVADDVGAVSQEAIALGPNGLYFVDPLRGVFVIRAGETSPRWLFENLFYYLSQDYIPRTLIGNATCGWFDNRLFVAVPWYEHVNNAYANLNTRMFVFDPQLGREGAWYPYEYGSREAPVSFGPMLQWRPNATYALNLAIGTAPIKTGVGVSPAVDLPMVLYAISNETSPSALVKTSGVPAMDLLLPDDTRSLATTYFSSYYKTAWVDARSPGMPKRWRRPLFLFDADYDATLGVQYYHDYSTLAPRGGFEFAVTGAGVATSSSPAATWGSFKWSESKWGQSDAARVIPLGDQQMLRGSGLGRAYAVSLRIEGTECNWGVNAIDFRYLPKRVK